MMSAIGEKIRAFYETLLSAYGPQSWWRAETPFEVVVGATQPQFFCKNKMA